MTLRWIGVIFTLLVTDLINSRPFAEAYSSGKGIDAACAAMKPFHGVNGQTSNPPFSITFSPASYTTGTPVSVTIKACTSKAFRGFMIQARRATIGSDQDEVLGSFTPVTDTQVACTGKGLVHTNSNEKTTLIFNWNPPAIAQGPVQFRTTFVHIKLELWISVKSAVLHDSSKADVSDPTTLTPPSTLASECPDNSLPAGHFSKDSDCDESKNCFSDCGRNGCTFQIKFRQDGADFGQYSIKTNVIGASDMYAAVGFSSDQKMGEDSVSGCIYQNGKNTNAFNAYNTGHSPEMLASDGVTLEESSYKNGVFSCTFKRAVAAGLDKKRFDLSFNWYLLFAKGKYSNNKLAYHEFRQYSSHRYSITGTNSGSVSRPLECGTSKGCISKCSGSSCETVISWEDDNDGNSVLYTLSSVVSSPSFLAIGFSSDNEMGGDSVSGCATGSDNSIKGLSARNTGKTTPKLYDDTDVTLVDSKLNGDEMTCTIKRFKNASADGNRVDITKKWVILFARGPSGISGQTITLKFHGNNFIIAPQKFSSDDRPDVGGAHIDYPLVKAHGSLMIAAWIFWASIGIVAARYYKPVWKNNLFSQKVWFQIHRTCMILVFCFTAAGFVIIFVEVKGWSDLLEEHFETHPIMGIIVTALTVLNPIMALFRPHPETETRFIFNWAHWLVGTAAHILGVITIFFGVQLRKAQAPDSLVYILAGYVSWQVLVTGVLEAMQFYAHKKSRQVIHASDDMQDKKIEFVSETPKTITIKQAILLVHVIVLAVTSSILIGFICVGEEDL